MSPLLPLRSQNRNLHGLGVWVLVLSLAVIRCGAGASQPISEEQLWQEFQSGESVAVSGSVWRWRGDTPAILDRAVTITGPGTLVLDTPNVVVSGSGSAAALTLSDVTLFYGNGVLASSAGAPLPVSSGPIPAINASSLKLTLANVTIMAPFRVLTSVAGFWSAADLLASLARPGVPWGPAPQRLLSYSSPGVIISNMLLLPSDSKPQAVDCYTGGVPVYDSPTMRAALGRTDVASVFVQQDILLSPVDFTFLNPVNITGDRVVELYGCSGTIIDTNYNWTRFSVNIGAGGALAVRNLTFANTPLLNQLFWPRSLAPLLGLVYVTLQGTCRISTSTIISPDGSDLQEYMATFSNASAAAQPAYTATNATHVSISRWRLTGDAVWVPSPGVPLAVAAASAWDLTDVTVVVQPPGACVSSAGVQGIRISTGLQLRQLIGDPLIPALEIVNDIEMRASEWPPEASGPEGGMIFVNRTKEIYACHPTPGGRYSIDFGNLGQVVFVFGTLRFHGSLLMTHPRPSPRRNWLYLLIGALSVETDGVILFDGVEIHGNVTSPFTNADDPFWSISCGSKCAGFIPAPNAYLNVTYYDAFFFDYKFVKADWVAVSQGRNITGTGFWGYSDVALTWRPASPPLPPPPADDGGVPIVAIAVPVAVGGALLLAGIVAAIIWARRRAADAASATAAAVPYRQTSEMSFGAAGAADPLSSNSHVPAASSKDDSAATGGALLAIQPQVGGSTMYSQATSQLSGSAPTEARIEDMKRAITSQAVLAGSHRNEQITLTELLGEGTFGKVYRGTWRGTTVAVKTMVLPNNMSGKAKREKMAVMETAISSSLSHPNIVQTYTYAVLPVKGDGNAMDTKLGAGCVVSSPSMTVDSTSPLAAMATEDTQNVHSWEVRLVLEFCDRGSLRDVLNEAVAAAAMKAREAADAGGEGASEAQQEPAALVDTPQPQPPPASLESCPLGYAAVLDTALDVARAMLHMHSENIVHGDLKARNILLKSGGTGDGRPYMAKVADFGLSLRIDPQETHVSNVYQGTITHMAPEVLLHGKVSKMSDVYAFAILMWEAYTAGLAFKGVPRALLGHEVTKVNRRPQFPYDTPFEFQLLACRCWESDPSIRPTFEQIIGDLSRMRAKLAGGPEAAAAVAHLAPISGSLHPTATGGVAGQPGGTVAMTAGASATPLVPMMYYQAGGVQDSVSMTADTEGLMLDGTPGHELFYVQRIDGSTMASVSMDLATSDWPASLSPGSRPACLDPPAAPVGAPTGAPPARPPPAMPPILETNPDPRP